MLALEEVKEPSAGEVREFDLPNGVKMKFVRCPPGLFTMGGDNQQEKDETLHDVTLANGNNGDTTKETNVEC